MAYNQESCGEIEFMKISYHSLKDSVDGLILRKDIELLTYRSNIFEIEESSGVFKGKVKSMTKGIPIHRSSNIVVKYRPQLPDEEIRSKIFGEVLKEDLIQFQEIDREHAELASVSYERRYARELGVDVKPEPSSKDTTLEAFIIP